MVALNAKSQIQLNQTQTILKPTCVIVAGTEKASEKHAFDYLLLDAFDTVLSSLECKQEIYSQLESKYNITCHRLPVDINIFVDIINDLFNEAALILELKLIQELHSKTPAFKYFPSKEEIDFSEYLMKLKDFIRKNQF